MKPGTQNCRRRFLTVEAFRCTSSHSLAKLDLTLTNAATPSARYSGSFPAMAGNVGRKENSTTVSCCPVFRPKESITSPLPIRYAGGRTLQRNSSTNCSRPRPLEAELIAVPPECRASNDRQTPRSAAANVRFSGWPGAKRKTNPPASDCWGKSCSHPARTLTN